MAGLNALYAMSAIDFTFVPYKSKYLYMYLS